MDMRFKRSIQLLSLGALVVSHLSPAQPETNGAAELERQLRPLVKAGSLQWLETGNEKWLALVETETTGSPEGVVILLHDSGQHLGSPGVTAQLRQTLPQYGWTTVSLYNPIMHGNALTSANAADALKATQSALHAAIQSLSGKVSGNWVLLGYGSGATLAAAALAADPGPVRGLVAVSLASSGEPDPVRYTPAHLQKIALPILDIYGDRDQNAVLASAPARAAAAKQPTTTAQKQRNVEAFQQSTVAENPFSNTTGFIAYRQVVIPGADHLYSGQETLLTKRVLGWLRNHVSSAPSSR